jgi:hypothetical protein
MTLEELNEIRGLSDRFAEILARDDASITSDAGRTFATDADEFDAVRVLKWAPTMLTLNGQHIGTCSVAGWIAYHPNSRGAGSISDGTQSDDPGRRACEAALVLAGVITQPEADALAEFDAEPVPSDREYVLALQAELRIERRECVRLKAALDESIILNGHLSAKLAAARDALGVDGG